MKTVTAFCLTALALSSSPSAFADDEPPPETSTPPPPHRTANNSVFVELLGSGGVPSVNYERILGDSNVSLRAGIGYFHLDGGTTFGFANAPETDVTFPVLANYYVGKGSHKLQVGAGALFWYRSISFSSGDQEHLEAAATVVVGYRYLPPRGGFNFGAGLTPMIGDGGFFPHFMPWAGVSLGGGF